MRECFPLLFTGAAVGLFSLIFLIAYLSIKDKKEAIGFDRNMKDSEITRRLLAYAKPHWKSFLLVLFLMLFSIAYDILSPLIVGNVEEMIKDDFPVSDLFIYVGIYAAILIVSLICSYVQAVVLQKTGQKILSSIREDLFIHIESLSHAQLHTMPVGKLVTRVTNDTNAISMMFTNILVNLFKNAFIIVGVLTGICTNLIAPLHMDKIMIGYIMLLIPGLAMTNAVRNVLVGNTISGIMRLIEAVLWAAALALGFMIAMFVTGGVYVG